jgi:hypothetical protein
MGVAVEHEQIHGEHRQDESDNSGPRPDGHVHTMTPPADLAYKSAEGLLRLGEAGAPGP